VIGLGSGFRWVGGSRSEFWIRKDENGEGLNSLHKRVNKFKLHVLKSFIFSLEDWRLLLELRGGVRRNIKPFLI
jgi:hypothetical protein